MRTHSVFFTFSVCSNKNACRKNQKEKERTREREKLTLKCKHLAQIPFVRKVMIFNQIILFPAVHIHSNGSVMWWHRPYQSCWFRWPFVHKHANQTFGYVCVYVSASFSELSLMNMLLNSSGWISSNKYFTNSSMQTTQQYSWMA